MNDMTLAPTQTVDVGANTIAFRRTGHGSPIVLSNRMRGTIDTWDPLFLDGLAREHTVIVFDYPGVGYSTGTFPGDIGIAANIVDDFTRALGLERYAALGWSWGGTVAQALVLAHPDRATHGIFLATNPPGAVEIPIQQAFLDRAFKPVNDLDDEIVLFFEPKSAASRAAAKASRERIRVRPGVDEKIPSTMPEIMAYIDAATGFKEDKEGRRDALGTTQVPILVLCGDNDISTAGANWFPLSGRMPTAQMLVLPDSGHAPQHQYPELAARYINLFIAATT